MGFEILISLKTEEDFFFKNKKNLYSNLFNREKVHNLI
jgi:hypothetical protein